MCIPSSTVGKTNLIVIDIRVIYNNSSHFQTFFHIYWQLELDVLWIYDNLYMYVGGGEKRIHGMGRTRIDDWPDADPHRISLQSL
jgi:hypothetical protein